MKMIICFSHRIDINASLLFSPKIFYHNFTYEQFLFSSSKPFTIHVTFLKSTLLKKLLYSDPENVFNFTCT